MHTGDQGICLCEVSTVLPSIKSSLYCWGSLQSQQNMLWCASILGKSTIVDIIRKCIFHSIPFALFLVEGCSRDKLLESCGPKDWLGWSAQCKVHPFYPSHSLNTCYPFWQMTSRWIQAFPVFMHAVDFGRCYSKFCKSSLVCQTFKSLFAKWEDTRWISFYFLSQKSTDVK